MLPSTHDKMLECENRLDLKEGLTQQILLQLRRIKSRFLPSAVIKVLQPLPAAVDSPACSCTTTPSPTSTISGMGGVLAFDATHRHTQARSCQAAQEVVLS